MTDTRLIEHWLPINEISIESIRERAGAIPNPAPHQLHVWWARRPLATARAAVAASIWGWYTHNTQLGDTYDHTPHRTLASHQRNQHRVDSGAGGSLGSAAHQLAACLVGAPPVDRVSAAVLSSLVPPP